MRFILKLFLILLLSMPLVLVGLFYLSIEKAPVVSAKEHALTAQDIARAKRILRQHDPRLLINGQVRKLALDSNELSLLGNYLATRLNGHLMAKLSGNHFELKSSFQLPPNRLSNYINLSFLFNQNGNTIAIQSLHIGHLSIPSWASELLIKLFISIAQETQATRPFINAIQSIGINSQHLTLLYKWNPELLKVARDQLISEADQSRFYLYQKKLIELSRQDDLGKKVSLNQYLRTLFLHAKKRSDKNSPVDENRAVLIVLGQHLSGRGHRLLFPETTHLHPVKKTITLRNRHDFAQHFAISAALAATGDGQLADLIGLQKELSDATRSSGFSFTDLAADRAGTYLGEAAIKSEESANAMQNFFLNHSNESAYMPSVSGLPEGIRGATFKSQYGSINSERFKRVERKIEQRLKNTALYKQMARY